MRAVVRTRYGPPDVLAVEERSVPDPAPDRVLVRVAASSVNALDVHDLRGEPFPIRLSGGVRHPRNPGIGTDLAGVVEAVGADVADVHVGDAVLGVAPGAWAELAAAAPKRLTRLPDALDTEVAGAIPVAGCTALQAVRDHGAVAAGMHVLIVGAGGGVGTFAVQIARHLGATVTATTRAASVATVESLGAGRVLDHARHDVLTEATRYDAIVDLGGTRPVGAYRAILAPGGRYVMVGGPSGRWIRPMDRMLSTWIQARRGPQRFQAFLAEVTSDDLALLAGLAVAGTVRPVIDQALPLAQAADAVRLIESGGARGKVALAI